MTEGKIELILDNPTRDKKDGSIASESTQDYPVNVIVNTKTANHTIFKVALRCTEGYRSTGIVNISAVGDMQARWGFAIDDYYPDEEAAESATYSRSLDISSTIKDTNFIIWAKVTTDGEEVAQVDTSVRLAVYGNVVPTS